jgi:hypothetical protein
VFFLTTIALLATPPPVRGETGVGLAPLPGADTVAGFAHARLTVADPNAELAAVVRAVSLRPGGGGPTVLADITVAPGAKEQTADVLLPATSPQQVYTARLLSGPGKPAPPLLVRELPVAWPVELTARARREMIDPAAYERFQEDLPRWNPALLRNVFLAAVIAAAALAAVLFLRQPVPRLLAVLAVAGAMTYGAVQVAQRQETLRRRTYGDLTVLAARRTAVAHLPGATFPLYRSQTHMDGDDLTIRPGVDLHVAVAPDQPRVFRTLANPRK